MARPTSGKKSSRGTPSATPAGASRTARAGSGKQSARARAKRSAAGNEPSPTTPPPATDARRPGTDVWLVTQENAWNAEERGLPPRRGSG